jgi:colicin import membrane protein
MKDNANEPKNRVAGLLTTIGVHALIVLFMFIIPGFVMDTPLSGEGIEVALGTDIEGGPDHVMAADGSVNNTPPPPQTASGDNADQAVTTDDNSDSKIATDNKEKKNPAPKANTTDQKTTKTETKAPERKADENSSFKKRTGVKDGNEGGSEESKGYGGHKEGNKGREDGNPNGNPEGTGHGENGKGTGQFDMKGRSLRSSPNIDNNFEQEGVLKLKIVVDRNGNVISISTAQGTTITNYKQKQKAIQQVKDMLKFNQKMDADEEQIGYYTIIYKKN